MWLLTHPLHDKHFVMFSLCRLVFVEVASQSCVINAFYYILMR